MPIALSKTLTSLSNNPDISINAIQWQNRQINLEFVALKIDITRLVEMSQSIEGVKSAQIKPHNADNTWVLEVKW